jgi:hypothetical protein
LFANFTGFLDAWIEVSLQLIIVAGRVVSSRPPERLVGVRGDRAVPAVDDRADDLESTNR